MNGNMEKKYKIKRSTDHPIKQMATKGSCMSPDDKFKRDFIQLHYDKTEGDELELVKIAGKLKMLCKDIQKNSSLLNELRHTKDLNEKEINFYTKDLARQAIEISENLVKFGRLGKKIAERSQRSMQNVGQIFIDYPIDPSIGGKIENVTSFLVFAVKRFSIKHGTRPKRKWLYHLINLNNLKGDADTEILIKLLKESKNRGMELKKNYTYPTFLKMLEKAGLVDLPPGTPGRSKKGED